MQHREHHHVVHQLEARVVAGDQVGHGDAEQLAEDGAQLGQAVQAAVVAGVGAVTVAEDPSTGQAQQRVGQIELRRRRLAAGQVEAQLLGLQVGVVAGLQLVLCLQFVTAKGLKRHRAPSANVEDPGKRGPRAPARAH